MTLKRAVSVNGNKIPPDFQDNLGPFGTFRDEPRRIGTNLDATCKEFKLCFKKATQNTNKKIARKKNTISTAYTIYFPVFLKIFNDFHNCLGAL